MSTATLSTTLPLYKPLDIEDGQCACGCGQATPIATKTNTAKGLVKGKPSRYLSGHHGAHRNLTLEERLHRHTVEDHATGCILYTGTLDKSGYGVMLLGPRKARKTTRAHRLAYELRYGAIPEGQHVHHTCHTRNCVNTAHLLAMSPAEHAAVHVLEDAINKAAASGDLLEALRSMPQDDAGWWPSEGEGVGTAALGDVDPEYVAPEPADYSTLVFEDESVPAEAVAGAVS